MSLPKSYNSADASEGKVLVFKGVSSNTTLDDFKELLDFNKVNHDEAERMKSKTSGRDQTFIKIKCDNPNKLRDTSFGGGLICQKTGIIFRVEEFRTTPSIEQCSVLSAKVWAQGTRLYQKSEMCCVW